MKVLEAFRISLFLCSTLLPAILHGADFTVTTNNDAITITRYRGAASSVIVPSTLDGYPVTKIGAGAFRGNTAVQSITLPPTITEVADGAFSSCTRLIRINFRGNAPTLGGEQVFLRDTAAVYYLPGTRGWGETFGHLQAVPWNAEVLFDYSIDGDSVTVSRYFGPAGNVVIPAEIEFLPVIRIDDWTFGHFEDWISVSIPKTVTSIGRNAFTGAALSSVNIPNSVTTIEDQAFGWTSLNNIVIPASVTNIGAEVFYGSSLSKVAVENSRVADSEFAFCSNLRTAALGTKVRTIEPSAFSSCVNLTQIKIPNNVTNVSNHAFMNCFRLKKAILGKRLVNIGSAAFLYDEQLESVIIGKSLKTIGDSAFYGTIVRSLSLPPGLTTIGDSAFLGAHIGSVSVPKSVTSLGANAFGNSPSLTNVILSTNINFLPDGLLWGCANLKQINIPVTVTNIGIAALEGSGLTSIVIPDAVENIGDYAFFSTSLTNVVVPNGVKRIGSGAFSIAVLEDIFIPESVTKIGPSAFAATRLTHVKVPESVTIIEDQTFAYCSALTNVIMGERVTAIKDHAFTYCNNLESFTIPESVTDLGYAAFTASGLRSITIPDSVTNVGSWAFAYCEELSHVNIGDGVAEISYGTFYDCSNLEDVVVGQNVMMMRQEAFFCPNLVAIYFKGNAPTLEPLTISGEKIATLYYLAGTTGWGTTLAGIPTALWNP